MDRMWSGVYWTNFLFGTVLKTFMCHYWVAGHFSIASNVKFVMKKIAIQLVIVMILSVCAVGFAYWYFKNDLGKV